MDRLTELEDRYEKRENPGICKYCGGTIVIVTDNNYGADADGRRGIKRQWLECSICGEQVAADAAPLASANELAVKMQKVIDETKLAGYDPDEIYRRLRK